MDILLQDLRYALRSLRRSPGFTAVVVAVLALGIGVNTMIFCMVYGVMFRPWPLPHFDRIMTISESNKTREVKREGVSWLNFQDFRHELRSFEAIGGFWEIGGQVTIGNEPEKLHAANITAGLLPALGIKPQLGRNFTDEETTIYGKSLGVVMISDRVWRRRFNASPDVLGKEVKLNGLVRTIVAVAPPNFNWPEISDFWIPTRVVPGDEMPREDHILTIAARLKPGVTKQQANAEIATIYSRLQKQYPKELKGWSASVLGFADEWRRNVRTMMTIMSMAVAFVLLIACANVANLMIARAATRKREISVRLALGASRARVVRALLTESLLLSLLGAALGVVLAIVGNQLWISMIPMELPFWLKFQIDLPVLAFTVGVATLSAVLFGLVPALQTSDTRLSEAIREGSMQAGQGRARHRARSALVVAEVALSLTLLVASGLMIRSLFAKIDSEKLVRSRGVLTANFLLPIATWKSDTARREFCDRVLPLVRALPGVKTAGFTTMLPLNRNNNGRRIVSETGKFTDTEHGLRSNYTEISPDYFVTLGIPIRSGRDFVFDDGPGAPRVAIVSQSLARALWPKEDALGRRLKFAPPDTTGWRTVVGVVADIPQNLEDEERTDNAVFVPHRQDTDQFITIVAHTDGEALSLVSPLRNLMRAQAPDVPLTDVRTMHEHVQFAVWTARLFGSLMAVFAVLALIIAAVGLYGVMAYSVAQRTQEIGIRMALGAQRGDVVRLVVGQAMQLTLIGSGIGLAAAFALTRGMTSQLFGISSTDPPTYVIVAAILVLSSVLAAWVPAYRATRVDPMRALRCD
jgi:putative ABC transport system permease protein